MWRDAHYTLFYETRCKCEEHLFQFSPNRISLPHCEYYMLLQKRRIDITFRGNTSLWWKSPVTPMIHAGIAMRMLQTRRKLCLKLEHRVKGLMADFMFLIFVIFVLLFTAYRRNSCDQPIRKLNDTYQRPFSIKNACAWKTILKCDDCAINSDCESADVHILASRLKPWHLRT